MALALSSRKVVIAVGRLKFGYQPQQICIYLCLTHLSPRGHRLCEAKQRCLGQVRQTEMLGQPPSPFAHDGDLKLNFDLLSLSFHHLDCSSLTAEWSDSLSACWFTSLEDKRPEDGSAQE